MVAVSPLRSAIGHARLNGIFGNANALSPVLLNKLAPAILNPELRPSADALFGRVEQLGLEHAIGKHLDEVGV